jgi:hypothetical protein
MSGVIFVSQQSFGIMNPFGLPFIKQPNVQPVQAVSIPSPAPVSNGIMAGRWVVVKSYQDATRVTATIDGIPTICMVEDDQIFYVVRNVDGRKEIGGFQYAPITTPVTNNEKVQPTTQQVNNVSSQQSNLDSRMAQLEGTVSEIANYMSYIKNALGEGVSNASVPKNDATQ